MATSQKPYLLRALYEWMVDNDLVPYLVVADPAAKGHVFGVPAHLLEQDNLTLNISPTATKDLLIGNEQISFHTRFAGQSHHVMIATAAVVAIFDRDTQQGLSFAAEALSTETVDESQSSAIDKSSDRSSESVSAKAAHLKIVK